MPRFCIITDSTAQFSTPIFNGEKLVNIVTFGLNGNERGWTGLVSPGVDVFLSRFELLVKQFDGILVLTLSSSLSATAQNAHEALLQFTGRRQVKLIDTQTTGLALGLLVQLAAEAASNDLELLETERLIRAALKRVYSFFCFRNPLSLAASGHLSHSQAVLTEMLGLMAFYTLDEGKLTPIGKVRTTRHMLDGFVEFMQEFNDPQYIGFLKSTGSRGTYLRKLRQSVQDSFPNVPYQEHIVNSHFGALLGPQNLGMVVMERI